MYTLLFKKFETDTSYSDRRKMTNRVDILAYATAVLLTL